ncbi:type 2 lanthipeptide synthetase LanM family protein [Kitasatospora sp. NPDC093558]|uniref:type 2 lanthipeptide synthetase LanM family protein n=1 Tax=Kitasatospora sp. NPDC093558 TaxID=3155201 RepID=UPI0034439B97
MTTPPSDATAKAPKGRWWTPGLRPGEPAGDGPPAWAAFVDEAVADADTPRLPAGPLPGTTGFRPVVAPLVRATLARVRAEVPPELADLPAIRTQLADGLADALTRRAARTLVRELHTARAAGPTPEARFRSFIDLTARRPGLSALLHQYPVLARILAQTCLTTADALTDLLDRFTADRADIVTTLLGDTDPGPLTAVHRTGDQHRRGHAVAVLQFADGERVVYKPRPLRAHHHVNAVIDRFNAQSGSPGLRTVALVERDGYGWTEFIDRRPCTTPREVHRFYLRQGAWLALLHAFDCTDLHFENLIACADHPVPVDLETLFHPQEFGPEKFGESVDPAAMALAGSVYRTGLLPRLILGDERALDASGLGGDAGATIPGESVRWEAGGTDGMRLVRRAGLLHGGANRPSLADTDADPADHVDAILDGYRLARRILADSRDELLALLPTFADDETRVVVRATADYATLLDESTHPSLLRNAADRDALLRDLDTDHAGWAGLVDDEVAELWNGDVPLFTTRPGTRDLWTGQGRRIRDALDHSGLDRVAARLRDLDADEAATQEWIVRAAMTSRSTTPPHEPGRPLPASSPGDARFPPPDRLLAAARTIGEALLAQAHRTTGRINWISLELLGDRYWQPAPAGADLGGGYPGPALFLAQLAALTGTDRYAEAARLALRPIPELLDRLADRPGDLPLIGSGAFAGLGGLTYALSRLATLLDDNEIATWTAGAGQLTTTAAEEEHSPALADGTAGGLAALLAVHDATRDPETLKAARRCADALLSRPLPAGPGFTTGTAGIGWALLRFARTDADSTDAGSTGHQRAGLAALRSAATAPNPHATWCEGAPGTALAIADIQALYPDEQLSRYVTATAERTVATGPLPTHSPCHGELGVLELLAHLKDPALGARTAALLAALDRAGPVCGTPSAVPAPGLLTGLAGIGHGLLRLGFPDHTPSALLLQAPDDPRPPTRTP